MNYALRAIQFAGGEETPRYCEITEEVLNDIATVMVEVELAFAQSTHPCHRALHDAAVRLKRFVDPTGFETEH